MNRDPWLTAAEAETKRWKRDRRERIATAALQGLLSNPDWQVSMREAGRVSVEYADGLIAELDKEDGR